MQVLTSTPYVTPKQKYQSLMDREYKEGQRNNNLVLFSRSAIEAGLCIDGFYEDIQKRDEKLNASTATTYEEVERAWHRASNTDKPKSISGIRGKIHTPTGVIDDRFGGKFGDEAKAASNFIDCKQLWSFFPGVFTGNDVVYCGPFDASEGYFRQAEAWGRLNDDALEILGSVPYFAVNPLDDAKERTDKHVTEFKHFLLEMDPDEDVEPRSAQSIIDDPEDPRHKQLEVMAGLIDAGIPIKSITYSGNKSFHAIVALKGIEDLGSWEDRVKSKMYPYFEAMGFDSKVSNPSRLTRLPGVLHENGTRQDLVYLNPKARPLTPEQIIEKLEPFVEKKIELYYLDDKGRWRVNDKGVRDLAISLGYRSVLASTSADKDGKEKKIYTTIRVADNKIYHASAQELRGLLTAYVDKHHPDAAGLAQKEFSRNITQNWCDGLPEIEVAMHKDTRNATYLYFKNTVLKITKDGPEEIPYSEIKGNIWASSVIPRDFVEAPLRGDFSQFILNISNGDPARVRSILGSLGSLINRHKSRSTPKAVIYTDEAYEEESGGTGKGILLQAVAQVRKVQNLDFKTRGDDKFVWQGIEKDTDVVHVGDVNRGFDFTRIYNAVADDWEVENKGMPRFTLPYPDSPKIAISTNYLFRGLSSSSKRRKNEIELSNHYSDKHQPIDDFGKEFFGDEWDDDDWGSFYNTLVAGVKIFHEDGLTEWVGENHAEKTLEGEIGANLRDFFDDYYTDKIGETEETAINVFNNIALQAYTATGAKIHAPKFNKYRELWADTRGYTIKHTKRTHPGDFRLAAGSYRGVLIIGEVKDEYKVDEEGK